MTFFFLFTSGNKVNGNKKRKRKLKAASLTAGGLVPPLRKSGYSVEYVASPQSNLFTSYFLLSSFFFFETMDSLFRGFSEGINSLSELSLLGIRKI